MEKSLEAKQGELGLAWEDQPQTRGENLPLMGASAGLEKAWRLADEGADESLASRGLQCGVGSNAQEGKRGMTPGPL